MEYNEVENSEAFKKGVQEFREGKVKIPSQSYKWVKGTVCNRDWNNYFSYIGSYTFLQREGDRTVVAFITVSDEGDPRISDIEPLSDEEAMVVDEYRRANNIYPRPLVEIGQEKELEHLL